MGFAGREGGGLNLAREEVDEEVCPTVANAEKLMLLELLLACLDDRRGCGLSSGEDGFDAVLSGG